MLDAAAVSTATEFCTRCGAVRDAATVRFCRRCGAPVVERTAPSIEGTATVRVIRRRPVWLVAALSIVTFNVYGVGWFGSSCADLAADTRDARMDPVGHALALLVPVYGELRAFAHFREIERRLRERGSTFRVRPRLLVAITI